MMNTGKVTEVNNRKIDFIICYNNELYMEECVWYINQLVIPTGYEVGVFCIKDAESIPQAYNVAMKSSDAKYKVYLHQDLFIYNRNFIQDIIKIFQANKELGLLGMIGGVSLPQNAIIWNAWNRGTTYACNNKKAFVLTYEQDLIDQWTETEAVDGMIMITQYDIPWREELGLGWDFYDVSQSLEFRRKGYKVGVPYQDKPWCMHDCGHSKLSNYDAIREKILTEYHDFFSEKYEPFYNGEILELQEKIFQQIEIAIAQQNFKQALQIKEMIGNSKIESNNLQYALNLLEIYEQEQLNNADCTMFFDGIVSWVELKKKYDIFKFAVRHWCNQTNIEQSEEILDMIKRGDISCEALNCIVKHSVC